MKNYEKCDLLLQQFTTNVRDHVREFSFENLNLFFKTCRQYYSTIEETIKQDLSALKILIRMIAVLPLKKGNIRESEAARRFSSIVVNILSEKLLDIWPTIVDTEWSSLDTGLVKLFCLKLLFDQNSERNTSTCINLISIIPNEARRRHISLEILSLLSDLRHTLPSDQETMLYELTDWNALTLKHLEVTSSLTVYINHLAQFLTTHKEDPAQLAESIQSRLTELLRENHFSGKGIVYMTICNWFRFSRAQGNSYNFN